MLNLASGCQSFETIDDYLNHLHQREQLNGNILVMKEGKIHYQQSFGFSDGTKNSRLTADFSFNIGSIYKEFPAVAIMQLKEQGLLTLDDNIADYVDDLPNWSKRIAIKHLLQYSSGLPRVNWSKYFGNGLQITSAAIDDDLKAIESLAFEPGTDYLYTNYSPILLISIVEKVTKENFATYVSKALFQPIGIHNIAIKRQYPFPERSLMAIPFDEDLNEDDYTLAVDNLLFTATAMDLAKWIEAVGQFKVLSRSSVNFLSATVIKGENIQSPLGRCVWENGIITEHSHHGASGNYECIVRRFPEENVVIVLLTNRKKGNVHAISDQLLALMRK